LCACFEAVATDFTEPIQRVSGVVGNMVEVHAEAARLKKKQRLNQQMQSSFFYPNQQNS
jgi:hypothetical protein